VGSLRTFRNRMLARACTAALVSPLMLVGGPAAFVTIHQMTPAVGNTVQYQVINSGLTPFSCQSAAAPVVCYGPDQIRAAYNIQPVLDRGITGRGRTIVIIDGFQSPTIREDLALFDQAFHLPDPVLTIKTPDGLTPFDETNLLQLGWAREISVDVEWAHAIAPGAAITLVLAKSGDDADILSATRYAVRHNLGDVISQSFGEAEMCANKERLEAQHELFREATAKGMTLLAASGDIGAAQPTCDGTGFVKSASTPASDPFVTGVGGTRLLADPVSGAYSSESGWADPSGASGGGFSTLFRRPGFQAPFNADRKARGVPDVAITASRFGGMLAAWGSSPKGPGQFALFSGTSAGTPLWAGIVALADQQHGHRLGSINSSLYHVAKSKSYTRAFHDITTGNNSVGPAQHVDPPVQGFAAAPGWDAVTGLGTPNVANLLPLISRSFSDPDREE
jgi:subtilase family serine protease